ncbi:MAG TPA: hypothetical protein VH253_11595 [Phycisphaerae bacterium]|nr:hypothetical protein [Phycisphaerae bacterium]
MACASVGTMRWSAMVVRRAGMVPVSVHRALVVAYRIQGAGQVAGLVGVVLAFVLIYLSQRKARHHAWSLVCMAVCIVGIFVDSASWSIV